MKKIILFLLLLPMVVFSQQPLEYVEVKEVDGMTKDQLFKNARMWVNDNFKSGKDVIQIQDKESGEITGNAIAMVRCEFRSTLMFKYAAEVHFSFKLLIKERKYKYIFDNFVNTELIPTQDRTPKMEPFKQVITGDESPIKWSMWPKKKMNEAYKNFQSDLYKKMDDLIISLNEKMKMKPVDDF